jgi:Tol biopolymer transport system component
MIPTRRLFALPLVLVAACGGGEGSDTDSGAPEVLPDDVVVGVPDGHDIWLAEIFDVVGGGFTIDEPRDLTSRPGYDNQPFFGDDGTLYFVQQEGVRTDVWRWDRGTDTKHRVTMTPDQSEYSPTVMPQSQGISMIRVEADSTQRLWAVDLDGSRDRVLLEDVQPVGYHAWFDAENVAVFVLGSPATLQIANVTTGEARTVAENIGRSLQTVPGRRAVSFAQLSADGGSTIRIWDLDTGRASDVAPAVEGGDFHAWTPGGTLLQGAESTIWAWVDGAWTQVGDFSGVGQRVSRLSVAPNGQSIAVVAEPIGGEGAP